MTQTVRTLLTDALEAEFQAFVALVEKSPADHFTGQPQSGHTAAWHALHVMDWTRCMIQPGLRGVNPDLTYGYLGYEDEPWAQAVTGPTLAREQDSQAVILAAVTDTLAGALAAVRAAPDERFSPVAVWSTPTRPRPVVAGLMYHVTHTAYHRGQLRHLLNQLAPRPFRHSPADRPAVIPHGAATEGTEP